MKKLAIFAVAITLSTAAFANNMEGLRSNLELTSFDAQTMQSSEIEMPADPYASRYQGGFRDIDVRTKINSGTFHSIGKYETKEAAERSRDEIVKNIRAASGVVLSTNISTKDNNSNYKITVEYATTNEINLMHGAFSTMLEMQVKIESLELSGMNIIFVEYKPSNIMGKNSYQVLYFSPVQKKEDCMKLNYGVFNSIGMYDSEEAAERSREEIVKNLKDNSALVWGSNMSTDNGSNYQITVEFGSKDEIHILKGSVSPLHFSIKLEDLELSGKKIIFAERLPLTTKSVSDYQILYLDSAPVRIEYATK